ncbi:MAG: fimbria/pilus outer membrane usher protein [Idiomarina sp.]|nr:fimbria/pilus outer membrane usher protein [Idiomarina sp.]
MKLKLSKIALATTLGSTILMAHSVKANVATTFSSFPAVEAFSEIDLLDNGQAQSSVVEHYLELTLNEISTGKMASVSIGEGKYFIAADVLRDLGLLVPEEQKGEINLATQDGVQVRYDVRNQRLLMWFPNSWFPEQHVSMNSRRYFRAMASPGALMNYDMYYANRKNGVSSLNLYHDFRVFNNHSSFFTSGAYQRDFSIPEQFVQRDYYRRYDTYWNYVNQDRFLNVNVGDVISRPLGWTSPVRLGGVQVNRDFSMRPDIITYPIPEFLGSASVPTTVDIFIDGVRASREQVDPGPFAITNIPAISGAGQATVVTTDIQGRRTEVSQQFYIASQLLKPGFRSYSVSAGAIRQDYGLRDFGYSTAAAAGSYRYGFSEHFTGEVHAEFTDELRNIGLGGAFAVGNWGVLELSARGSEFLDFDGHEFTVGYGYRSRRFSFSARHTETSEGFIDLAGVANQRVALDKRSATQVNASLPMGTLGSLSGGYFENTRGGDKTRVANITYARSLFRRASTFISYNRVINEGWFAALNITMPFGPRRGVLSTGYRYVDDGQDSAHINYNRSAPLAGGFGYSVGFQHRQDRDDYRNASVTWRGDRAQLRSGFYGTGDNDVYWAEASGAVVVMDRKLFASNRVRDSFVVVSTAGYPNVPIRYENQTIAHTDRNGYALIPNTTRYYAARYTVDSLALPPDVALRINDTRVAVKPNSGYLLEFEVEREYAAHVQLVDTDGNPLPMGSTYIMNAVSQGVVGYDGLVYLQNIERYNQIQVEKADGSSCFAGFEVRSEAQDLLNIIAIKCQ